MSFLWETIMSNTQQIYIGAYMKVKLAPYNIDEADNECPEHGDISELARDAKFCPECGSPLIKVFHKEKRFLSYYDICDDDDLMEIDVSDNDDEIILISNLNIDNNITIDYGCEGVYNILNSATYINEFVNVFKRNIKRLVNNNMVILVSYHFGAVVYWN